MSRAPSRVLPALLGVVALVAGWRTVVTSSSVLGRAAARGASSERQAVMREEAQEKRLVDRVARDDSLLAALATSRAPSDPFRPRVVEGPVRSRRVEEPVIETPVVLLIAFDRERPEVVLRVGGKESTHLRQGQVWEGWTVVLIDRTVVELSGFEKTVRISVPNQTSAGG